MRNRELESLAMYVHGALAFGHALGLVYNVRKKNKADSVAHGLALAYDLWAAYRHWQDSGEELPYQAEARRMAANRVNVYAPSVDAQQGYCER